MVKRGYPAHPRSRGDLVEGGITVPAGLRRREDVSICSSCSGSTRRADGSPAQTQAERSEAIEKRLAGLTASHAVAGRGTANDLRPTNVEPGIAASGRASILGEWANRKLCATTCGSLDPICHGLSVIGMQGSCPPLHGRGECRALVGGLILKNGTQCHVYLSSIPASCP